MSLQQLLADAAAAAIREAEGMAALTAVFDAPPVRAARPYAVVDEVLTIDWSTKDMAGREGRLAVLIHDAGERPVRLRALIGAAEEAMAALPRALGEGWWIASLVPTRIRIAREGEGRWVAMSEWRVRALRES